MDQVRRRHVVFLGMSRGNAHVEYTNMQRQER